MGEHKQRDDRIVALESRVGRLEQVSDINAGAFSSSLQFAEVCIQAVQRVLDDSLSGTIKTVEVDGVKKVDFKAYLQDVLDIRMISEKVETGMAPESALRSSDSAAFEFGG